MSETPTDPTATTTTQRSSTKRKLASAERRNTDLLQSEVQLREEMAVLKRHLQEQEEKMLEMANEMGAMVDAQKTGRSSPLTSTDVRSHMDPGPSPSGAGLTLRSMTGTRPDATVQLMGGDYRLPTLDGKITFAKIQAYEGNLQKCRDRGIVLSDTREPEILPKDMRKTLDLHFKSSSVQQKLAKDISEIWKDRNKIPDEEFIRALKETIDDGSGGAGTQEWRQ
jgi:hypothetical protein